ncbi:MAG: hypothetical protein ACFCU7_05175 [Pleurocapsa sp.]
MVFISSSFALVNWVFYCRFFLGLLSQEMWTLLAIALIFSLLVSLTPAWSMLWVLVVIPFLTTLLAVIEIQSASFSQKTQFLLLATFSRSKNHFLTGDR